ncbi:hypothetical protein HOB85_01315 [Candidatus Woesearchaeota archaeon]|nr:hypothetical protein [Candidatus Woesearchaeota archaeon]
MKRILIALMAFALVFVSGCGGGEVSTLSSPYYGGSQGIIASFEPVGGTSQASTTNAVFEGEIFPVDIQVLNKGEYTLEAGELIASIKGINLAEFGSALNGEVSNPMIIERVSEFLPEGGTEFLNFGEAAMTNVPGTFYEANFFAEIDYHYQTHIALPQVCFKEDLRDERICDATQPALPVFSSGAPIIATKASQKPAGQGRVMVEVEIANVGTGKARVDSVTDVDPRYDEVTFQLVQTAGDQVTWECTSRGSGAIAPGQPATARLSQGAVYIRCRSSPLPDKALYTSQMDLILDYWYQDIIGQTITVNSDVDSFDNS